MAAPGALARLRRLTASLKAARGVSFGTLAGSSLTTPMIVAFRLQLLPLSYRVFMERAFSHPDVSCFRAEGDQSSDHHRHHSGNPRQAPNCSRGPFARR